MPDDSVSASAPEPSPSARGHGGRVDPSRHRDRLPWLLVLLLLWPAGPVHAQEPVEVFGRVVVRESGDPLQDATVRLYGSGIQTITETDGTFRLEGVPPGEHVLEVSHIAYGEQRERLQVDGEEDLAIEVIVSQTAIELAPLLVAVSPALELESRASGTRFNEITRAEIVAADSRGLDLARLLTQSVGGLRERRDRARVGTPICLEFRGAARGAGACRSPVVYLDGVRVSFPSMLYGTLDLASIERLQVIPPAEAGVRFGSGAWGAVLIDTRRPGSGSPDLSAEPGGEGEMTQPRVTWDWSVEARRHPGKRVFASAFVGNTLGLAAGAGLATLCLETGAADGVANTCGTMGMVGVGVAAVLLPALGGSVAGRMAGVTPLSQGELVPSLVGSTFALIPAYILGLNSELDFGTGSAVGVLVAAVGAPLMNTIADRLFRRGR